MDRLSTLIKAFIDFLQTRKSQAAHTAVKPFLSKLLDIAGIFKDACHSEEGNLLEELLLYVLKQESTLSGTDGLELIISLMKAIDMLFTRLVGQVTLIMKGREQCLAQIDELRLILDAILASESMSPHDGSLKVVDTASVCADDFQAVCTSSNYITHYVSHHRDFSSLIIVVLWKGVLPGPAIIHEGMPLVYICTRASPGESFAA